MRIALHFVILLCLSVPTLSGTIQKGDIWVDYANAGSMKTLSFSFMLQTALTPTDYIKVSLPFPLHSSLIPAYPATQGLSLPHQLYVTYQYMDNSTNILTPIYQCQALTQMLDSSIYYIRFYQSDNRTLVPIPNYQWFYLKFELHSIDALQYQIGSTILQIQLSSVSSVWPNAMIYDDNLAFNFFSLEPAPIQNINLTITPYAYGNNGSNLLTYANYSIFIDININYSSIQYQMQQKLKLILSIKQKNTFIFNGLCSSVAKTSLPVINALASNLYTCNIDTINNIMIIILSTSAIKLQNIYRFYVPVLNPPFAINNVSMQVKLMKQYSSLILGYGIASNVFQTKQIYTTYQQIFIGWGMRPDPKLLFDVRIFRANSNNPTYKPYNSLQIRFKISRTTSPLLQLKVQIDIPSQINAYVLPTGFSHNFPPYPNKQVKCVVQYVNSTVNRKIACTGIGSLDSETVYSVGWKMYFPYDIFQNSIDCSKFAVLSIYTVNMIDQYDNVYIIGRGQKFLNYIKQNNEYYVLGRNTSHINYILQLGNITLIALSTDFQQFLSYPQQIVITNRPSSYQYSQYNNVYVIQQNVLFNNYIKQFNDIYIAYKLKSKSDIGKSYRKYALMGKTMVKNTINIKTCNSKDWSGYSNLNINSINSNNYAVVSSQPVVNSLNRRQGLQVSSNNQSLIFSMNATYSEVTSTPITNASVTNNWGMLIMMNSKIKVSPSATAQLTQQSLNGLTASVTTISSATAYNNYTLITLRASSPSNISVSFPTTPASTIFSLFPFTIQQYSSVQSNQNNMDIMIVTIDGIDGPTNKLKYISYFIINSYTLNNNQYIATYKCNYVAYSTSNTVDGSQIPTLLRITGNTGNITESYKIYILIDKLQPYYYNKYSNNIYCMSSQSNYNNINNNINICKYISGMQSMTNYDYLNYNSYSIIQIQLNDTLIQFDVLIPIQFIANKVNSYLHMAYSVINGDGIQQLVYVSPRVVINIVSSAYTVGDSYGPVLTGITIGQPLSPLLLQASTSSSINVNSGNDVGGAYLYFAEWDYFSSGNLSISAWPNGPCYILYYLLYSTNYFTFISVPNTAFTYVYKNMGGIVCFTDNSNAVASATITLAPTTLPLPSMYGANLPGYGAYSQSNGLLLTLNTNYMAIPNNIYITNVSTIATPVLGSNMYNTVGIWQIQLPIAISDDIMIVISANANYNLPFTATGACSISILPNPTLSNPALPITCNFIANPTNITYILSINQTTLLPISCTLSIYHHGISTNSSLTYPLANTFTLKCYTLHNTNTYTPAATDLIFYANNLQFYYGSTDARYNGPTKVVLAQYVQITNNRRAITEFTFAFSLTDKNLYMTERVRINLGQYYVDNAASLLTPTCKIYYYQNNNNILAYSHDWSAVDISQGLNNLQYWPKSTLIGSNLTYLVNCANFIATAASNPLSISAKIANTSSDPIGYLSTTNPLSISSLPSLPNINSSISINKKYNIPSSMLQLSLIIVSPGITTDSILYIGFPFYYSSNIGETLNCYTTYQIYCRAENRKLVVKFIGNYVSGIKLILTITGIQIPINTKIGTFWYVFDDDDNLNTVLSTGTFLDTIISNNNNNNVTIPTLQILQFNLSSYYLRDNNVALSLDFYLPSNLNNTVANGQYLMLAFPPNYADVLRFVSPQCQLNIRFNTAKSFISSCTVYGMRIKMPILISLTLGSVYRLTIKGLINPTNPSSYIYKHTLQLTTPSNSILARSFSPHCNFLFSPFSPNPISIPLNFYTESSIISQITTYINIQSQPIYISTSLQYKSSVYNRNVYLSSNINIFSNPYNIVLQSGSNPYAIRLSAFQSGIYFLYYSKQGDGNYYCNLPPLTLIVVRNYNSPISFIQQTIHLPISPIYSIYQIPITLPSQLYPSCSIQFNISLSNNNNALSLTNMPTMLTFSPSNIQQFINITVSNSSSWIVGTTITMQIISTDNNTYNMINGIGSIILVCVNQSNGLPLPAIAINTTYYKQVQFNIGCSQYGYFVYHVSHYYNYNTTACTLSNTIIQYWLQQPSIDSLRANQLYYNCYDQIGVVNILQPNTTQLLTIAQLQASTNYILEGYCSTYLTNTISSLVTLPFSTLSNGGYISKFDIYFYNNITVMEKIKTVCALALLFQVQYTMVSTVDGYYCTDLLAARRLLFKNQQQVDKQVDKQVVLNNPQYIKLLQQFNKQGILLNEEQEVNNKISYKQQYHAQEIKMGNNNRMLWVSSSRREIYFGINTKLMNDTSSSLISSLSLNQTQIINALSNVADLTKVAYVSPSAPAYVGLNDINPSSIFVDVGPNYVYVQGMTMPHNGIIYIIIGLDSLWYRDPVISEIKSGSGPDGLPPLFFRVLGYRTSEYNSSYAAFMGIGDSKLRMYIVGSDDNPFDTANFGPIRMYEIKAEVAAWQYRVAISIFVMLLVAIS